MPKMKTKRAAAKRFRTTGRGKVRANVGFKQHNLRKRQQDMKRERRGTFILKEGDADLVRTFLPYGRRKN